VTTRWIPKGRRFSPAQIVFFAGRGRVPLGDALARCDLLITAPHATAAIPEELRPFLDPRLSYREQFDFSDASTRAIGRRWAAIDRHVVYIENPHPRLVLDPSRRPSEHLEACLHEAFRRVRRAGPGRPVDLAEIDAVRPVTFANRPVLLEPRDPTEWRRLLHALRDTAAAGTNVYTTTCDRLLDALLRTRHGVRGGASMLHVMSLHDTMAARIWPSGAIAHLRPPTQRLPHFVSLGNRGDARGEAIRGTGEPTTIAPPELRRITAAFRGTVGVPPELAARHVAMNRVYTGKWDTIAAGARIRAAARALWPSAEVPPRIGAYMAEFAREALLDPDALAVLRDPGDGWPRRSFAHVDRIARTLKAAYDRLRDGVEEADAGYV
jgi:hypothetical protein